MPSQLVSSSGCCQPCDSEPVVVNIPGPQGAAGANGTNGANGIDSFTYTTASFFVPALGASVFAYVTASDFLPESVAGQFFVSVQGLGYMQVTSVDGLRLTLQNPAAGVLSIPNAIPTTLIPAGSLITLAGAVGPQGPAGAAGGASSAGTYIVRIPDASIPSATALDSLSAGYLKTQGSGGFGAVSTVASVPVADISGVLPIAKGGTNLSSTPTNGQLLIGNGTGYTLASLTAGSNITITPGAGTISIAATGAAAAFVYETFTRRVSGTVGAGAPQIGPSLTKNPFSLTEFPSGSWTGIDTASRFTAATGRFTAALASYYRIDVALMLSADTGTSSTVSFKIRKNGTTDIGPANIQSTNSTSLVGPFFIQYIDQASIGDYYEVLVTTSSLNTYYVREGASFSIQRIQA
jgi:hypothetical protein